MFVVCFIDMVWFTWQCVDEWLKVNASCPTCRKSILPSGDVESGTGHSGSGRTSNSSVASSSSTAPQRSVLHSNEDEDDDEEEKNDDNYANLDNESVPLCP
jgi:hypothetical protein